MIYIKKGEEWKITFHIKYRFFKYLVMPFGLINISISKQELINNIFKDILDKYIIIYLDNILVYSNRALEDYIKKVYKILKWFNKKNLKFRPEKCRFYQKKTNS